MNTSSKNSRKKSINSTNITESVEHKKKVLKTSHGSGIKPPIQHICKGYDDPNKDADDDTDRLD